MNLRCVIVDDESISIEVLKGFLDKIPKIEVVATFNDPFLAIEYLSENVIDFIFLDIEMPSLSGVDLLKSLVNPPLVVITTANKNRAIEGYELNVADYLLKPMSLNRIIISVNRISKLLSQKGNLAKNGNYIFLKENKRLVRVNLADILFVESMKDYIKVVTKNKSVISKYKLESFQKLLNPEKFVRVHKSYVVSLDQIEAFSSTEIEIGRFDIPIGRTYKDNALKHLYKFSE